VGPIDLIGGAIGLTPAEQASIFDKALESSRVSTEREVSNRKLAMDEYNSTYQAMNDLATAYEKMQTPTAEERKKAMTRDVKTDVVIMNADAKGQRLPPDQANAFLVNMQTAEKRLIGPVSKQLAEQTSGISAALKTPKPTTKDVDRLLVQEFLNVARNELNTKYGADSGKRMQGVMKDLLTGAISIDKVFDMLPINMQGELVKSRLRIATGLQEGKTLAELSIIRDASGNVIGAAQGGIGAAQGVVTTEKKKIPGWSPGGGGSGSW